MRAVRMLLFLSLAVVAFVPFVHAQAGDARPGIDAASRKFEAAFAKGDSAGIAALYTATAMIFPPNAPAVTGTQGIAAFWKAGMTPNGPALKLTTSEVATHGDMAHETGTYTITASDGKVVEKGKYVVIWKNEGGQWKLHRDIWNSDSPAAAM